MFRRMINRKKASSAASAPLISFRSRIPWSQLLHPTTRQAPTKAMTSMVQNLSFRTSKTLQDSTQTSVPRLRSTTRQLLNRINQVRISSPNSLRALSVLSDACGVVLAMEIREILLALILVKILIKIRVRRNLDRIKRIIVNCEL